LNRYSEASEGRENARPRPLGQLLHPWKRISAFCQSRFGFSVKIFFLFDQKINSDFCLSILSPVSNLKPLAGREGQ
jgi:hypothetical protein